MTSPLENDINRHHLVTLLTELLLRALRHPGADGSNEHEPDDQIDAGRVGPVRAEVETMLSRADLVGRRAEAVTASESRRPGARDR